MEFERVIKKRAMIRAYQDRDVPDALIEKLTILAQKAPSAGFTQPVEFIVVRHAPVKRALADAALGQNQLTSAPVTIAVVSDTKRSASQYGDRGKNFYSIVDGAFAAMIILLACVDEGLGACFVAAFDDEKVSEVLGLPDHVRPIGLVTVGYPREKPSRRKRISLSKLIHENVW